MSEITEILAELNRLRERVAHLETRQEHPGFAASDVARLSQNNTFAGVQTVPNTGLHILDTNASHDLIIAPGSNLTADRTLTVTTGDADRTLTLSGNLTVDGATTITAAAATVLDDSTVAAMVNTLGGASSVGSGGLARATSPVFATDITTPAIKTASGALTVTPAAGSGVTVVLSTTGDFSINTNQFVVDTSTGNISAGIVSPPADSYGTHKLNVATTSNVGLQFSRFSANNGGPVLSFVKSRDAAVGSHAIAAAGDRAGTIGFSASDGTVFDDIVQIYAEVDAVTGTVMSGRLGFKTTTTGGTSTVRMLIDDDGNVLVGTTTDSGGRIQIDQSSTTAAIPALRLNQADISEGFIDYIGTSAASAAGPISTWTVATLAGFVRCEINGVAYWQPYYNAPTA